MARVVLAMSGGVDSSVAAHLLVEAGHDVIGVFMRHGHESPVACLPETPQTGPVPSSPVPSSPVASGPVASGPVGTRQGPVALAPADRLSASSLTRESSLPIVESPAQRLDHKQGCCTASDAADARRVADRLGIPFYALNLDREFQSIIDYFVAEYGAGRTPNPCVQCNNWIKFGKLFDYADGINAEFVATGHYARRATDSVGRPALLRGVDASKDQSYVLFGVRREDLSRMLLPVGGFRKAEIRARAAELGLAVATKQDSQEICFVTRGRYDEFVRSRLDSATSRDGDLVLTDGKVVGRHRGIEGFTVGQRKGLGVALGEPHFVVHIDPQTRRVVLGDRSKLECRELRAARCNWLIDPDSLPSRCLAQIRYNAPPAAASIAYQDSQLVVRFDAPQYGVAPGQAVVCYAGDQTLGGGWIE